jgi:hypothetical protein
MAVTITNIDPVSLEAQFYSPSDTQLVPSNVVPSNFNPDVNYIEYTIQSSDGSYQITTNNFTNYTIVQDSSPAGSDVVYDINLNPETDLINSGFSNGNWNVIYNFLNSELNSSFTNQAYYIKEISSDRTEIRIASNTISNSTLESLVNSFFNRLNSTNYFQDFYLNFGGNNLIISNNILLDNTKAQYEILINLYEPLPSQFKVKDTLWVVTQVADPLAFNVFFTPDVVLPSIPSFSLKGPNLDLPIKDKINNSSNYVNYEQLFSTGLVSSYNQILSYLNDSSINIGVDYTDFENFIHFSSAKTRVQNFYYKVQLLEQYNSEITLLSTAVSASSTASITILQEKVSDVIKNFDGFEYYLYYESSSTAYPKTNTSPPYDLFYSQNPVVLTWLGSDDLDSPYYGGLILSASNFDHDNQDYLINTIPDYLRDDPQNDPYKVFVDMIGQFYDNIWVYYKDVSNRYNGDNRLDYGISKDLVADGLKSFGLKIYQNNFSTSDLYSAFSGFNLIPSGAVAGVGGNGSFILNGNVYVLGDGNGPYVVEGQFGYFIDDFLYIPGNLDPFELITNYITASQDALFEPLDDVNKEIYKRLYHNLPLLLKQKGTVAGLRNLINIYGIPDTILRISEFGGRDRDETTYDYFYNKYNYSTYNSGSSPQINTAWDLNTRWSSSNNVPECIQFRFKTETLPTQSSYGLWGLTNGPTITAIVLKYTGSGYNSGSYEYPDSGSKNSPEWQYAKLDLIPDIVGNPNDSASVYLPFYDNNWWSVSVSRSGSVLTLYAGNKLEYDGYDGNLVGFIASSSTPLDTRWILAGSTSEFISVGTGTINPFPTFTGSLQEIRYWATSSSLESFKDFVMNPGSTDIFYTEDTTYANKLAFRLPLGNELYTSSTSVHPKITGSWTITQSFSVSSFANYTDIGFNTNIETYFFNSPIAGARNRITDKIQIVSSSYPPINLIYTQSGDTLTQYREIAQSYPSTNSETPDINALEVAFSPTNEIDDDIISSLGYFNIGEYIGDPRQIESRDVFYPDLNKIRDDYFLKYFDKYTLYDYIRLIKFFDNSLFKMIKDFVPARTNLRSGIVIKPHLLERNKYPQPLMDWENVTYSGSIQSIQLWDPTIEDTYISSSLIESFAGSTGGTFNEFNNINFSQSWYETTVGPTGSTQLLHNDQSEFYDGELPGTVIDPTNGELNEANPFKYPSNTSSEYDIIFYNSSWTTLNDFLDYNTTPNPGEIYLWFDTGSILNPGQDVPIPGPGVN